jgi:hypothetical protein
MGIRQLDLRVAVDERDEFQLLHSFSCIPLQQALREVNDFLDENSGEIVVINIKPDWPHKELMTEKMEEKMFGVAQQIFGEKLTDGAADFESLTLQDMVKKNQRVIISYGKHKVEEDTHLQQKANWNRDMFDTPWPNTSSLPETIQAMENNLMNFESQTDKINGLSFILTPQVSEVVRDIFKRIFSFGFYHSEGVRSISKDLHKEMYHFIDEHEKQIKSKVSVISTDFADETFARKIIELNDLEGGLLI